MTAIALYDRVTNGFDDRVAHAVAVLRDAARDHAGHIVQATSLGAEDMVVTDLIARHGLGIALGTLETGKLHAQTVALIPRIEERYGLAVEVYRPQADAVIHFVQSHGEKAMYKSIELRKGCCGIRKLEPLSRMLDGRTAWITGLRREQSGNRGDVPFIERTTTAARNTTRLPTGLGTTSGITSRCTRCHTTRCTMSSCRASAVNLAPAPSPSERISAPAGGGGRMKKPRSADCTSTTTGNQRPSPLP